MAHIEAPQPLALPDIQSNQYTGLVHLARQDNAVHSESDVTAEAEKGNKECETNEAMLLMSKAIKETTNTNLYLIFPWRVEGEQSPWRSTLKQAPASIGSTVKVTRATPKTKTVIAKPTSFVQL